MQLAEQVERLNWTQQELQRFIASEGLGFLWLISVQDQNRQFLSPFSFAIHQCSVGVFSDCMTPPNENRDGNRW